MKGNLFKAQYTLIFLITISATLFFLSGYVNQVPWFDDKAYLNNALIHSGRVDESEVLGPYADERPPLFWWMLTVIFIFNAPIWSAKFLSPFFGVVLIILIYSFTKKLFKNSRQALYSSLFLMFNAFLLLFTGMILTDVPSLTLSTLLLFCLYYGIEENKHSYLIVSSSILAFSIMLRDQNIILFPIILFYLLTKIRLNKYLKALIASIGSILPFSIPIITYGITSTLEVISRHLTPFIIGKAYLIPFTSVGISLAFLLSLIALAFSFYPAVAIYFSDVKNLRQIKLLTFFLSVLTFFITLYPYLWDNYALGARFEVQGRGILSRLISHQIMAETFGVGADLPAIERRIWWLSNFIPLISIPIFLFSIIGLIQMVKNKMYHQLAILIPWLVFTSGFTILFTHLEARFLLPSLPPFAIISSEGFVKVTDWIKFKLSDLKKESNWINKARATVKIYLILISLIFENLVLFEIYMPEKVGLVALFHLLNKILSKYQGWFSDYLIYLENRLRHPILNLDPIYILEAIICLVLIIFLSFKLMMNKGLE
ncbi:glycosyltransferase family 39 protein [Candidatus Bathyarchaeota archaeon]|nr:glycosyltransferase family 39 protein [Candidatus Bathyarchaeota archaeon]